MKTGETQVGIKSQIGVGESWHCLKHLSAAASGLVAMIEIPLRAEIAKIDSHTDANFAEEIESDCRFNPFWTVDKTLYQGSSMTFIAVTPNDNV